VGRLATEDLPLARRSTHIRLFQENCERTADLDGYRAILSHNELATERPIIERLRNSDHFRNGDIVVMEAESGFVRSLYRPYERHHSMFVTERCSSNCLMCSQPPKDKDDVASLAERNRELIQLMDPAPEYLTITGGEPTLLGDHLFRLIGQLKTSLPKTELHMLTNGRAFAWSDYAQNFAAIKHPSICLGIPLYSDCAGDHDHIVQAKGAFDQTVAGLQQAARYNIRVEVRVVLHRLTIPRLECLVEYIYRNLSFVEHVALMGLEHVGYTPRNIDQLWIDPFDYQDELERAVRYLTIRDISTSLYNQQLCVLRPSLWPYSKKAISDWKSLYLPECQSCAVLNDCGGLFKWAVSKHSEHIRPF
jgi:His-Xaa-Ser system radical SAM maturase HxsC